MRKTAALTLLVLLACGGAQKPAGSSADTSSLETGGSPAEKPAPSEASEAPEAPAPKASATAAAPAAAPSATASASTPAAPPAASFHQPPAATGSIDGKPFSPKVARSMAPMQKDGRLLLTLTEGADCTSSPKASDGALTITVEWKNGYKTDVGSLKRATKAGGGEVGFSRMNALSRTFKPTGRVTVLSAPTDANATGKLKLDVQSGDFMLAGDIDVLLCVAAK
jgi:hypothetical protein